MNDKDKVVFRDFLLKTGYYNRIPSEGRMSGRGNYIQSSLDDDVSRILNLDNNFKGKGVEKIVTPASNIDIYTRREVTLGLKLSGHSNTLTEARSLIDELYKIGEKQNEQQYRKALNKFSTH